MISTQGAKVVQAIGPVIVATNATASAAVDTLGYDYATVLISVPKASATDSSASFSTVSIAQGDAATGAWTDISGFTGATASSSSAFLIPTNNDTSVGATIKLDLNLLGRKRFLKVYVTPSIAANTTTDVKVILTRAEQLPTTATAAGVALLVQG
jgi:hypothetical protein